MIEIIPAIDIISGRCVRLSQGEYSSAKQYDALPVEVAQEYEAAGVRRLHIVDLDGAKNSEPCNLAVLEQIRRATLLDIEWGGGVKSREALAQVLDAGADRVICGSIAVSHPDDFRGWIEEFGADKMILGADVRNGKVAINGWLEDSQVGLEEIIEQFLPAGLNQVICTDISRDGMLAGVDCDFYTRLQTTYPSVDMIVSGGISSVADIEELDRMGLRAVIVGKALYEGRVTLKELEKWLQRE